MSQSLSIAVTRRLRRLLSEPILHFIVLGLAILVGHSAWRQAHDTHRIVVTEADAEGLARKYQVQFGAPPNAAQKEAIIQAYIEEEALFREGTALGLDRGDEIVRRRIAQKAEFLQQDTVAPREPSEAALRAYYEAHRIAYAAEPHVAFRHVFFTPDIGGETAARRRAETALARLIDNPSAVVSGDPFPDIDPTALSSAAGAVRVFGDTELPRKIGSAPIGRWSGPYRSGYGWHLLLVQSRQDGGARPYATVRSQVRADWLRDAQDHANRKEMAQLLDRYTVVREDKGGPAKAHP